MTEGNPGVPPKGPTLAEVAENRKRLKEEAEREAREAREKHDKSVVKQEWLRDGGDEESFERAWPQLRDDLRKRRVAEKQEEHQRRTDARYRSAW